MENGTNDAGSVQIFDTTLRDGEQAPGFSMNAGAKLKLAKALVRLRVDVIEAGFAAASLGDAKAIELIAASLDGPTICSLARARRKDIEIAAAALKPAGRKRIHVFIATSPLHRAAKLGMTAAEVLVAIKESVAFARDAVDDVEFSAEDAVRTEPEFLAECLSLAALSGASTLNVPDTVGYSTPDEIFDLFRFLDGAVDRPSGTVFSAHCHDDLGLACANSLAAVQAGARQVECTLHGIGERAGNCAMEEVVMALRTRRCFGLGTRIDVARFGEASRTLTAVTGIGPSPNKAIVGANAFAHASGIHQHGVLSDRSTYEIMRPEDLGLDVDTIVLGKHSGRHGFIEKAHRLGYELGGEEVAELFSEFKSHADCAGTVTTAWLAEFLERRVARTQWSNK